MLKRAANESSEDFDVASKKICMDKVSRVLHVRNVSNDVSERDIANLAIPFGLIKYLVLTRKTGQALMEMAHEESAKAMVNYYLKYPAQFYGKNIIIQYSRYESLSGKGMHPDADMAVKHANDEVRKLCENDPRLVLHVSVENWEGPRVGHMHFYKLFQRFGVVCRIIVFIQNPTPQALVELESEVSANVAKLQLAGSPCFYGHNLRVEFSNRKNLDIKHESDTGRDYLISPVSKEEMNSIPNPNQISRISSISSGNNNGPMMQSEMGMRSSHMNYNQMNGVDALSLLQPLLQQAMANPNDTLPLLQNLAPSLTNLLSQGNLNSYSGGNQMNSGGLGQSMLMHSQNMNSGPMDDRRKMGRSSPSSPVLIIDNLNEDKITPDALFILFGSYGDVLRVKILFNKKSTALVQFVDADQAGRALDNLGGVILYGKPLKINYSKHQNISMPKPDEQNSVHLNKDYSNSRLHRFKRVTSRTLQNIYPPGAVLHVAGLSDKYREEDVRRLFENEDYTVKKVKMIPASGDKKMALVQLESTERAIEALIKMHDYNAGNSNLRVSFSKGFIANN